MRGVTKGDIDIQVLAMVARYTMEEKGLGEEEYLLWLVDLQITIDISSEVWLAKGMGSSASYLSAYLRAWLETH